jgi:hypothetical protein
LSITAVSVVGAGSPVIPFEVHPHPGTGQPAAWGACRRLQSLKMASESPLLSPDSNSADVERQGSATTFRAQLKGRGSLLELLIEGDGSVGVRQASSGEPCLQAPAAAAATSFEKRVDRLQPAGSSHDAAAPTHRWTTQDRHPAQLSLRGCSGVGAASRCRRVELGPAVARLPKASSLMPMSEQRPLPRASPLVNRSLQRT